MKGPYQFATPQPGDRLRHGDKLPYPFGRGAENDGEDGRRLPGYLAERACYQPIYLGLDSRLSRRVWHEIHQQIHTGLENSAATQIGIETGLDGQPAAMVPLEQIRSDVISEPARTLLVFRSRDALWAGFRYGEC